MQFGKLNKFFLLIFCFFVFSFKTKLIKFDTKQNIQRIRFVSQDGKVTYFQSRYGHLNISKNFRTQKILEGNSQDNYEILVGESKKKVVVTKSKSDSEGKFLLKNKVIYIGDFGEKEVTEIASGLYPRLHMKDNFLSYFAPQFSRIFVINLDSNFTQNVMEIKINNNKYPFFIPEFIMIREDLVYYTDVDNNGMIALFEYNSITDKKKQIKKVSSITNNLSLCRINNKIYVFDYSFFDSKGKTLLFSYDTSLASADRKFTIHYESNLQDFGKIICKRDEDDFVYFIKSFEKNKFLQEIKKERYLKSKFMKTDFKKIFFDKFSKNKRSEVVKINIKSKKLTILSDVKYANNFIKMDNNLLIKHEDNVYILEGKQVEKDEISN